MHPLNYCRQMVKHFSEMIAIPSVAPDVKAYMSHCIDLAKASHKFLLPDGGRLYDDKDYRALDEREPLNLPYPLIAIEFERSAGYLASNPHTSGDVQPRKALLFARQREDCIAISVVVWAEHVGRWVPYPEVALPRTGYINRGSRINGYVGVLLAQNPSAFMDISGDEYMDEVGALLCLLNVLQCRNVHVDTCAPSRVRASMTRKGALPFDTYHVLTIDAAPSGTARYGAGSHRSPREHLRRGHIRRLEEGRRIWVNATVVAAGRGAGVVSKDYAIHA